MPRLQPTPASGPDLAFRSALDIDERRNQRAPSATAAVRSSLRVRSLRSLYRRVGMTFSE